MKKKLISVFLSIILGLYMFCPAFASSPPETIPNGNPSFIFPSLKDGASALSTMSVSQLNSYISSVAQRDTAATSATASTTTAANLAVRPFEIRLVWYAAALIAQKFGFPCAGTIVEHAALGEDYMESNGLLARTIQTTQAFKNWVSNPTPPGEIYFSPSDSIDLYCSLRNADVILTGSPSSSRIRFTDTFDFKPEFLTQPSIISAINDIAWLSQKIGALPEIEIQIDIVNR